MAMVELITKVSVIIEDTPSGSPINPFIPQISSNAYCEPGAGCITWKTNYQNISNPCPYILVKDNESENYMAWTK